MSHTRQQIREAIATLLGTTPTNWVSVTETRIQSQRQVWPYLMVFSDGETTEKATMHTAAIYERSATIFVVGLLRLPGSGDTQTIEDKMDAVAEEIETKLTFATLKAVLTKVESLVLESTKMDVIIEEDGIDHAEVHQTWRVSYATLEGVPGTFI